MSLERIRAERYDELEPTSEALAWLWAERRRAGFCQTCGAIEAEARVTRAAQAPLVAVCARCAQAGQWLTAGRLTPDGYTSAKWLRIGWRGLPAGHPGREGA